MKKILALGASNSSTSINRQLAEYAANKIPNAEVTLIDLNDFEMPIYGMDKELAHGIPAQASQFKELIKQSDGIIISFAEHNGIYSAAYKNVIDWTSRLEAKIWMDTPLLLLATSPGGRGGKSVLGHATSDYPHRGALVIDSFSLPSFGSNFADGEITDEALRASLNEKIELFTSKI